MLTLQYCKPSTPLAIWASVLTLVSVAAVSLVADLSILGWLREGHLRKRGGRELGKERERKRERGRERGRGRGRGSEGGRERERGRGGGRGRGRGRERGRERPQSKGLTGWHLHHPHILQHTIGHCYQATIQATHNMESLGSNPAQCFTSLLGQLNCQ